MIYLGAATVAFIINYFINRKKLIDYAVIASAIYLVAFIFVQSFDILFVLYVLFFIIPYIGDLRWVKRGVFVSAVYIIVKFGIAFFHEPVFSVIATFLTRYFPIMFLVLATQKKEIISNKGDSVDFEQHILRLITICDVLIAGILVLQRNSDIFVVSHQPVGANLSVVGIYLVMDISLMGERELRKHKSENIFYALLFTAMALISGIRGYIIIVVPCAAYSILNYIFGEKRRKVGLILSGILAVVIFSIGFVGSSSLRRILTSLDTGIGYRTIENKYFLELVRDSNVGRWLLGYWIGSSGTNIGSNGTISALASGSAFYYRHLMTGPTLLNFWFTVAKDTGIIGLGIYIYYYILIGRRDSASIEANRRTGVILYLVLYAFMLMYRTSCTNGMIELFMVSSVANYVTAWGG